MQNATFIETLYLNATWAEFIDAHLTYPLEFNNYCQLSLYLCLFISYGISLIIFSKIISKLLCGIIIDDIDLQKLRYSTCITWFLAASHILFSFTITSGMAVISCTNVIMIMIAYPRL